MQTAEKESPAIPKGLGYAKKGGEIITKHDTTITGRKNACKAMQLGGVDIGDGGGFDMKLSIKVYNLQSNGMTILHSHCESTISFEKNARFLKAGIVASLALQSTYLFTFGFKKKVQFRNGVIY